MTLVIIGNDAPTLLERVPQGEARREHPLRDLIHDNPVILPLRGIDPSYGRLFTVARELSIPGVGFIDVLLADERGRLVIVECKLWRNPQARREVVGQILDYARRLSRYSYEDLQRQISIATRRQGNVLFELAREAGGTMDEAEFVDRVSRDLAAGRFLLLIAGDGITEGTRRIGEYLRDQPGLAFDFALIEFAEYRGADASGNPLTIVHPRVLAQTAVIERHVIRSEVPGIVIDAVVEAAPNARSGGGGIGTPAAGAQAWRTFMDQLSGDLRFDDPGQPMPRWGGMGWLKLMLPHNLYVNLYRSSSSSRIGAQIRFAGEAVSAWSECFADRAAIDAEFVSGGLPAPTWNDGEEPDVILTTPSPAPWDDEEQARQRQWLATAGNQFVNSFRPRLQAVYS